MTFEVEMKFPLPGGLLPAAVGEGLALRPRGVKRQRDQYFNHPCRDFAQTDEALRLRDEDGVVHITYKGPKLDGATKTREEIELPLGLANGDVDSLVNILIKLGFRAVAVVAKQREEFNLLWEDREVTLSVDQVDQVGSFLEIEIVTDAKDLDSTREAITRLARHLGLGNSERRSYLELLLSIGPQP